MSLARDRQASTRRFPGRARSLQRGLTLVEILIVVALIALLVGTVAFGSGMFSSNRQRAAATLLLSGVRVGLARANTTGRPARLVFDLEQHKVTLEETASATMLREQDDAENSGAGADPATEAEKAAREEASRIVEGPRAPRPSFQPAKGWTGDDGSGGRELGKGIKFRMVQTEHDGEPRVSGRAYLYFWPGGQTERAVIQVTSSDEAEGLSVLISPLTGRARIERGRVPLPEPRFDGEYSEREE